MIKNKNTKDLNNYFYSIFTRKSKKRNFESMWQCNFYIQLIYNLQSWKCKNWRIYLMKPEDSWYDHAEFALSYTGIENVSSINIFRIYANCSSDIM